MILCIIFIAHGEQNIFLGTIARVICAIGLVENDVSHSDGCLAYSDG